MANLEVEFMILDGVMVILASTLLTVWHPGRGFEERWNAAGFQFRSPKIKDGEDTLETPTLEESDKMENGVSTNGLP